MKGSSLLFALLLVIIVGSVKSGFAQVPENNSVFQSMITGQIQAFRRGDADTAFSYATKDLQRRFQTPDIFMQMVKQAYRPVYQPRTVTFGAARETPHGPMQDVYVTGPDGGSWRAVYSFEQQADGTWRISGCYLTKSPGIDA
ncbi:DUF4864 domain-containing protein [Roseibium sp. RKSG952]|uniref:DUF4864 domain-containing protein n=1 Tax=Roseibium sp. RKSG952 TaxID=2529384 RepID=UPI0012BC4261|nr:DUF4864 domain-containing protein [Roseibium sp. RKSG952]MTH97218.1 DUF4864 domain-containing protein [Roseibium sp. RKSG952]